MTASLPRFRSDLATSRQVTSEGVVFVIKDPIRDTFYRLPEEAYFIIENLDGQTPLTVVRQRTEEKFGATLPPAELDTFVDGLGAAGLLDTGQNGGSKPKRARRIQGSPLYLRVRFFDPDRLFNYLVKRIRLFFTPLFMVLSACVIVGAVCIAFANWAEAVQNLPRLFQYSAIPLILPVVFLVITAHEFAHGLTCKHFGGEVHELGFFLIYFQPALYCNVSDAWLFPEKAKRLWVSFAGPYFELFLWSLATIVWRVSEVDTWINYIGLIVMTTSGIKTLFNFNPLIKLDGYYLLSDYLEIPNLRRKSFSYIGSWIKRLAGATVTAIPEMPARELRICVAYGLMATVGSFSLLGMAVVTLGGFFVEQNQPITFALFTGLVGVKFRRRFRRLFGRSSKGSDDDDDGELAEASVEETNSEEIKKAVQPRPSKRRKWKFPRINPGFKLLLIGAVAIPILVICRWE